MSTLQPDGDPFAHIERVLAEQQMRHFELAGLVAEYREGVAEMRAMGREAGVRAAVQGLPGAKYHVTTTLVRETWLHLEADLKRALAHEG